MEFGDKNKYATLARLLPVLLILITLAAYGRVYQLDFVNYDDGPYVYENQNVKKGITSDGVIWALTEFCAGNWHPLTMLSLMLDVELFGVNPTAHHIINLLLHLANTLFLFLILRRSTGRTWPSALAAALFAVHPLHVESVAWISERKDVLSTLFGLGAILAYLRYVRRPGIWRYAAVALLMALSLLSKAMLVTLPGLLFLLDLWPLNRIELDEPKRLSKAGRLLVEKVPLWVLSIAFSLVTILAQKQMGAMPSLGVKPLGIRLMNATLAYVHYLIKTVWPLDLAVFYPYPQTIPPINVVLSSAALILITLLAIRMWRRAYFLVGWSWYLVSLLPVIGIVQVGMQSMADRYTYIPSIGLFIIAGFGLADLVRAGRLNPKYAAALALAVVMALTILCYRQTGYWRNGETLFRRALAVTENNHVAHNGLGLFFLDKGRLKAAEKQIFMALAITPKNGKSHRILGEIYYDLNRWKAAEQHLRLAIKFSPSDPEGYFWLGEVLRVQGRVQESEPLFRRAVEIEPTAQRYNFLGLALAQQSRLAEARRQFQEALRLDPEYSEARSNLNKVDRLMGKKPPPQTPGPDTQ